MNWKQQVAASVRSYERLNRPDISEKNRQLLAQVTAKFPMAITPYYLGLIDQNDPEDPLWRMVAPSVHELKQQPGLKEDPIDEASHNPLPGLIRRYPDRALLLVSGECAVYCRHCTRRQLGVDGVRSVSGEALARAIDFIRRDEKIRDVILSGGDPFLLEDEQIADILAEVRAIPHVDIIRIGTRTPVVLPMRIQNSLAQLLRQFHPLYVNTQFNHPREITTESARAISLLVDAGIPVANQAVLLRGVNDTPETIEALCRSLLKIRVRPYYLFLCDLWPSLEHLRTSIDTGIAILEHLRGKISGLAIPTLVADLPGGVGKIPLVPDYVVARDQEVTILRSPDGTEVRYPNPKR